MNRRGWAWFQAGGALVLLLAGPGAIAGLMDGVRGSHEVFAATTSVEVQDDMPGLGDLAGAPVVATAETVSTP